MSEAMKAREAIHATSFVKPEYAREFRNEAIAAVDAMEAEIARLRKALTVVGAWLREDQYEAAKDRWPDLFPAEADDE